jgi:hypothetical protein
MHRLRAATLLLEVITLNRHRPSAEAWKEIPCATLNRRDFAAAYSLRKYVREGHYLAHETVIRRATVSSMGPISFAIFSFVSRIASRAPDFYRLPHDTVIEVEFSRRYLTGHLRSFLMTCDSAVPGDRPIVANEPIAERGERVSFCPDARRSARAAISENPRP